MFQRVPSRATLCWSQRTVCSTTFTTRPSAGSLTAGMSQLRSLVRTATSPYAASPCCCLVAYLCSRESNLFAVPSTSKVSCTFQPCTQNFALSRRVPRIFHWGAGADPEAICNLCFILKIMLQNLIINITIFILFATAYIQGVSRLVDITAGGDSPGLCDQKSSYKHVSDFGRLRSYDRLKLRR